MTFSETEEYQKFLSKMVKVVKGKYRQNINQYQVIFIQHHPYLPGHVCPPCYFWCGLNQADFSFY
jgi:hypothetical protein